MKIIMIGPFPPPIHGMSLANKILLKGLKKNNEVTIFNTNTERKFENLNKQGGKTFKRVFKSFFQIVKGLLMVLFSFNIDIIYLTPAQTLNGYLKYTPFMWAARVKRIPYLIHIRGGFFRKMYNLVRGWKKKMIDRSLNGLSGAIVLGPSLKYMFEGLIPNKKIFICENGAEDSLFAAKDEIEAKVDRYKTSKTIRVLYLSNLMEAKGVIDLLKAVKIIKEKGEKIHLDVAGSVEPSIKKEVESYFKLLDESVSYHGVVEGNKKKELLLNNYLFCLPSKHPYGEGQPNSILEAMSCGCIPIVTDLGSIKDVVKGSFGVFVEKGNVKDIIAALEKNYDSSMILNSWKEANKKYKSSQSIARIEKVLIRLYERYSDKVNTK